MSPHVALYRAALLVLVLTTAPAGAAPEQPLTVKTAGGALHVRAPGFTFLEGAPLARLQDGRSVRVELTLTVLPVPGRTALATVRRLFGLSYDLWEERLAVSAVDAPRRTISHLTAADAEAWCIEQLSVPLSALASLRQPDASFRVRLEYRIPTLDDGAGGEEGPGFTLQGLIDVLSRRHRSESRSDAIEAGPFQLPSGGRL